MTYLIRICNNIDTIVLKTLINRKFCNKIVETQTSKYRFIDKWYHFTKRKFSPSGTTKPLPVFSKISAGIIGSISANLFSKSVLCSVKKNTRITGLVEEPVNEPDFNWKKFFQFLKPYTLELIGAILAALMCALFNIQIPRALGMMVDVISRESPTGENFFEAIKLPAYTLAFYYGLQSVCTFFYIALLSHVGEGLSKNIKMAMFTSLLSQDISFFDSNKSGEILNRLTVEIQDFKSSLKMVISQGLRNFTQIIGCSVSLLLISPKMTSVMLIIIPSAILAGTYFGSLLRQLSFKTKMQGEKLTLIAQEAICNIRTVRAFAMEELESKIMEEQVEIHKNLNIKLGYGIALFQAGTNLFLNGMVLSTLYLGGYMMTSGSLTAGDIMAFLVALQTLQKSFTQISTLFGLYIRGKHAGARVFEIIDLPPGRTLAEGKIIPYHSLIPNVEYKDVVFAYPGRPQKNVLKSINLRIPEGKTVAIVGYSGSGKSTLAWLLERFYDVENGAVLVGEENVKNLNPNWLRKNVLGFISQEPVLFGTTVMENIRYGKPSASDDEVVEVAKLVNADSFIRDFPDGYQTMVGERGLALSGGQKQRIAIARAILKNPSILILDEATSALDAESEKAVQKALENVTKSRTTIVIAHRLSTVKNADLIVVLDNGAIVESGTHQELLKKKGKYATLVAQQLEGSKNNKIFN